LQCSDDRGNGHNRSDDNNSDGCHSDDDHCGDVATTAIVTTITRNGGCDVVMTTSHPSGMAGMVSIRIPGRIWLLQ